MQTLTEPDTSLVGTNIAFAGRRHGLGYEKDCNAIVLHFFENRTPQEVAAALKN